MIKNQSLVTLVLATCLAANSANAQSKSAAGSVVDPDIAGIATDAYIFGYPLVSMYVSKRVITNAVSPMKDGHAPINQVGNLLAFPTAAFKDVVAPNVNTLHTSSRRDRSRR